MENLKSTIGTPEGLVICTDACKGLEIAIHTVFPTAEHRECFRHMIINFRKKSMARFLKKIYGQPHTHILLPSTITI